MIDWARIKSEYITGTMSLREIAKKNGIGMRTLAGRSSSEGWQVERNKHRNAVAEKSQQKSAEIKSDSYAMICRAAEEGIRNIMDRIGSEDASCQDIRALMLSLETAKGLLGIKSEADMREQEARIAKLRSEVADDKKQDIVIRIDGGLDGWES